MPARQVLPGAVPIIGQQRQQERRPPTKEEAEAAAQTAIGQAVQQLSLQIYSKVAAEQLDNLSDGLGGFKMTAERQDQFHQLARHSRTVAQAFFEGLGIAEFESTNGQKEA